MNEQPLSPLIWEGDRAPFAKAFVAAQKATEAVKKAASNPAFKSKYADLSSVVEAVIPALNEAGIGVLQSPGYDGEMVSITTTLIHEGGSSVTAVLHLRPSKVDPQGVGSAITYGRRYSLLAITGAAPEDDDGNAASGPRTEAPRTAQHVEHPPLSLEDRALAFETRLKAAKTAADLKKAWNLGAKLCGELDVRLPERLVEITATYEACDIAMGEQAVAA